MTVESGPALRRAGRLVSRAAALLCAALVASCGGGGSQVQSFAPGRIVAFGDDSSAITATGHKYTVNALDATTNQFDCKSNPVGVQYLTQVYHLPFKNLPVGCIPDADTALTPVSIDYAKVGAKVADVSTQIDQHVAAEGFSGTDLAVILVGQNDVLEQYALYPGQDEATITATLEQRGTALAALVNRVVANGAKVLVVTVPELSLTPFSIAEQLANADTDRRALLQRLTDRFNAKLRTGLPADGGRSIGLVQFDDLLQNIASFPTSYGFADVVTPACAITAPLPDCTTATLSSSSASATTWLWADNTRLSAGGQQQLGSLLANRASNQPFSN